MGKFIQYDHDKNKGYRNPAVTITKNGSINFNAGMLHKFIKNKIHVILYYDRVGNRIGFEFLSEDSTKAFKIRKSDKNNFGTIAGRSFLNFNDIPYAKTNKYQVEKDKDTNYIVIHLKKQEKDKGGNKENEVDPF